MYICNTLENLTKMKFLYFLSIAILCSSIISCSTTDDTDTEEVSDSVKILNPYTEEGIDSSIIAQMGSLSFVDTFHDFGTILGDQVVEWDAEYTNTGSGDVLIQYARSTCGCTVPNYKKEPIKPGESGLLKITFDASGKQGIVDKAVTIETNGFPNTYTLNIRATISN